MEQRMTQPDLSVVICTYNRPELLRLALTTLLRQSPANLTYEVVVIDNNSTPDTRAVVDELAQIVAFLDDDVTVRDNWIDLIQRTFEATNAGFIGGKVLPRWEEPPPSWLDMANWAPIAALDYGDSPFLITDENALCLLTANIAFKKEVFAKHGEFSA